MDDISNSLLVRVEIVWDTSRMESVWTQIEKTFTDSSSYAHGSQSTGRAWLDRSKHL